MMTKSEQYNALKRAIRVVINVDISPDDYKAIIQLMIEPEGDLALMLENTCEDL